VSGLPRGYVLLPGQASAHFFDASRTALCGHEAIVTWDALRQHMRNTAGAIASGMAAGAETVPACRTCQTLRRRAIREKAGAQLNGRVA
jgi:hypothetical protein